MHPDDNFTWSTQQLTGFLAAFSSAEDGRTADNGTGMHGEVVSAAFERFYSTTGGTVEIDSTPGGGTTVEVLLPATDVLPSPAPGRDDADDPAS